MSDRYLVRELMSVDELRSLMAVADRLETNPRTALEALLLAGADAVAGQAFEAALIGRAMRIVAARLQREQLRGTESTKT